MAHVPDNPLQTQLQSALSHIADVDYLNSHPLAQQLPPLATSQPQSLRLRDFLLGLIEQMKPNPEVAETASAWRHYVILRDRYTLQHPLWEIGERMALGERQVRREHRRALSTLAVLVAAQLNPTSAPQPTPSPVTNPVTLEEAVQRLNPAPRVFGLAGLLDDVAAVIAQSLKQSASSHVRALHIEITPPSLSVFADRGILHQLLLRLSQLFVRNASTSDDVQLGARLAHPSNQHVKVVLSSPSIHLSAVVEDLRLCHWLADSLGIVLKVEPNAISFALPLGAALRTVMIVDDELAAIELFQSYLTGLNYHVVSEIKPEAALARAQEVAPHVILIDVMMPAMDGWELLQRLRHTPALRDVPIIACSVLNDADLARALGATQFLKKPILRQQLIRALEEVLG